MSDCYSFSRIAFVASTWVTCVQRVRSGFSVSHQSADGPFDGSRLGLAEGTAFFAMAACVPVVGNPVAPDDGAKVEPVTLVPFGCTLLRQVCFIPLSHHFARNLAYVRWTALIPTICCSCNLMRTCYTTTRDGSKTQDEHATNQPSPQKE